MTTPVGGPNFDQLNRTLVGVETVRGTKVTPTNKWYGAMAINRHQPLADTDDYGGTWFGDITPVRGAIAIDGTYMQKLAYEDAHLFRYGLKGGVTGTDDTNTVHGYTYLFQPSGSRDDLDTFSAETGDPLLVYESQGLFFPEWTVSADIDDAEAAWKFSSKIGGITKDLKTGALAQIATGGTTTTFVKSAAGWTVNQWAGAWVYAVSGTAGNVGQWREVASNTSTTLTFVYALPSAVAAADVFDLYAPFTAGISDRTRELVKGPGTKLYLDTGTIGTTQVTGRFMSFSVTYSLGQNTGYKRFMENITTLSNRMDRGKVKVTGQVRLEMDRRSEWDAWVASSPEKIRILQTGAVIDSGASTNKAAQIDIYAAQWDDPTFDTRGNNKVATWPFVGYQDVSGTGYPIGLTIKNTQSVLLA